MEANRVLKDYGLHFQQSKVIYDFILTMTKEAKLNGLYLQTIEDLEAIQKDTLFYIKQLKIQRKKIYVKERLQAQTKLF
jgi:hypothetical protein